MQKLLHAAHGAMCSNMQRVKGTFDLLPDQYILREKLLNYIVTEVTQYGYRGVITPIMEDISLFTKSAGDDLTRELYYISTITDKKIDCKYVMRPEGTASIIRMMLSNALSTKYQKYFYYGPMFRHDRPQKGRFREFNQFGIEYIGSDAYLSDAEVIYIAYNILNDVTLHINTIGTSAERNKYIHILQEYFHTNMLSSDVNRSRIDTNPLRILDSKTDREIIDNAPSILETLSTESQNRFHDVCNALNNLNVPYVYDHTLVRGLEYYCHTVFEFKSNSLEAAQNTVLAGGRYNNILNTNIYGVGWAAGIERLLLTDMIKSNTNDNIIVVSVETSKMFSVLKILKEYNVYAMHNGLSKDIKNANDIGARLLIFQDNTCNDHIVIKDLLKHIQHNQISISNLERFIANIL